MSVTNHVKSMFACVKSSGFCSCVVNMWQCGCAMPAGFLRDLASLQRNLENAFSHNPAAEGVIGVYGSCFNKNTTKKKKQQ